jgi:environmental stress-induced protein Ves
MTATVRAFHRDTLAREPWKNAGGTTHTIVRRPQTSDPLAFDWRVSVARIDTDAGFSTYDGIDRAIVLLDGPGVRLRSSDGAQDHTLTAPLQSWSFAGETALQATLRGAACEVLNVMTRRSTSRAQLLSLGATGAWQPVAGAFGGIVLAVHGHWRCRMPQRDEATLALGAGLWWQAAAGRTLGCMLWAATPDARLLGVRIEAAGARP